MPIEIYRRSSCLLLSHLYQKNISSEIIDVVSISQKFEISFIFWQPMRKLLQIKILIESKKRLPHFTFLFQFELVRFVFLTSSYHHYHVNRIHFKNIRYRSKNEALSAIQSIFQGFQNAHQLRQRDERPVRKSRYQDRGASDLCELIIFLISLRKFISYNENQRFWRDFHSKLKSKFQILCWCSLWV